MKQTRIIEASGIIYERRKEAYLDGEKLSDVFQVVKELEGTEIKVSIKIEIEEKP